MKPPRISIDTLMAAVVVVALDCMIVRSVSVRPESFTTKLTWMLLASLPMAHVLAVGAALLARGPIRARPFLLGFEVGGVFALLVANLTRDRFLEGINSFAQPTRVEVWLESLPEPMAMLLAYSVLAMLFLIFQLIAALSGGWWVRRIVAVRGAEAAPRPRWVPPMVAVLILAVPALAIVGYLRWVVDPQELRRPAGSVAVVDLTQYLPLLKLSPKGLALLALEGTRVRIERDADPCVLEVVVSSTAPEKVVRFNDYRIVRVTLLDGDRAGESTSLPHCFLRAIR